MNLYSDNNYLIRIGLLTGILGMVMWVVPTVSIFINIFCLHCAFRIIDADTKYNSIILSLGVVSLLLTILRTVLVYSLS